MCACVCVCVCAYVYVWCVRCPYVSMLCGVLTRARARVCVRMVCVYVCVRAYGVCDVRVFILAIVS